MFQSSGARSSSRSAYTEPEKERQGERKGKRIWRSCWLRTGSSVPAVRPSTREPSVSYSFAESDLSLPLVDSIFTLEDFACAPSRPLPRSSTSAQTSRGTAKGGRGRGGSKVHEAVATMGLQGLCHYSSEFRHPPCGIHFIDGSAKAVQVLSKLSFILRS